MGKERHRHTVLKGLCTGHPSGSRTPNPRFNLDLEGEEGDYFTRLFKFQWDSINEAYVNILEKEEALQDSVPDFGCSPHSVDPWGANQNSATVRNLGKVNKLTDLQFDSVLTAIHNRQHSRHYFGVQRSIQISTIQHQCVRQRCSIDRNGLDPDTKALWVYQGRRRSTQYTASKAFHIDLPPANRQLSEVYSHKWQTSKGIWGVERRR